MKENKELERSDIAIDRDLQISDNSDQEIVAYLETWFDVDRKFGTHTADDDNSWVNLYAAYNPFTDSLMVGYEIDHEVEPSEWFDYDPTNAEAQLIKDLITEKIREQYNQTPQEFCEEAWGESLIMGGQS